jgi:predicted MFS family arabinose efflux permease
MADRLDSARRWAGLAILCLVAVIASTGQTLVSVLLQPIKADLGFSDAMIGLVTGIAISVVGGLAAFPIAAAADRYGRRLILAASIIAWSIAAVAMGLSSTAAVFSIGVMGFNLGDAALLPLLYAMVPALFEDERRHRANAILVATLTACAFGVFAIGGLLLDAMSRTGGFGLAPWRAVFIVVAFAGLLVLPLLALLPGARSDLPVVDRDAASWSAYFRFLRIEGMVPLTVIAGLAVAYAAYMTTSFWAPAMLQRRFAIPTADAGIQLGWMLSLASLAGIACAALILRRVTAARGAAASLRVMAGGLVATTLIALALPLANSAAAFVATLGAMSFAMSFVFTPAPLVLQDSAPDRFRSRMIAFFPLLALGIRALSLPIIGYASDVRGGDAHALIQSITILMASCLPLAALIFWRIEPRYARFLQGRGR